MTKYSWVVLTNAAEGREDEFGHWYGDVHIPDVFRASKDIVSARRYKLAPFQMRSGPAPTAQADDIDHHFLTLYEIETDDLAAVYQSLRDAGLEGRLPLSSAMTDERLTLCFEPASQVLVNPG
ncbi:MAG: hypothetical protein ABW039_01710 [Sphingobium sp.]